MHTRLDRARRAAPVTLGAITLAGVGLLFAWDLFPLSFPAGAHDVLAAFPLAMIAVSYLVYSAAHRATPLEFVKAIMLAIAFLCWAANQRWPGLRRATLLNDIAIALFVLDVFLVMIGWPAACSDESPAKTHIEQGEKPSDHAQLN